MVDLLPCPFDEMDRAIMALALELPGPVWNDVKKRWDRVRATRAPQWQPTHRHKKRGTKYQYKGAAYIQTEDPLLDNDLVAVYVGENGQLWVRPMEEFEDGRFKELTEDIK